MSDSYGAFDHNAFPLIVDYPFLDKNLNCVPPALPPPVAFNLRRKLEVTRACHNDAVPWIFDCLRTFPLQAGNVPADKPVQVFENVSGLNRTYGEHRRALDSQPILLFVYDHDGEDINHNDAKVAAVL